MLAGRANVNSDKLELGICEGKENDRSPLKNAKLKHILCRSFLEYWFVVF